MFENVSLIIFNYDRAVEQYLPFAIQASFGMGLDEARSITGAARIFHPYGSLGELPWDGQSGVAYGSEEMNRLPIISRQIRTFTEQVEDKASLAQIKDAVGSAERLVFIGFGYHSQNLELIYSTDKQATNIWATAYEMSSGNQGAVRERLLRFLQSPPILEPIISGNTCKDFLQNYEMALTR